jgi:flavin-dependent dehydrogenase
MGCAEVLIVGGGPAGAVTALQLARRGIACRVLEASPTFQPKIGETLPPNTAPMFARLGLSHLLQDPAHVLCHGNQFIWGDAALREKPFFAQTQAHGWHLDRARFESQLAELVQAEALVTWQMGSKMLRAEVGQGGLWQVSVGQEGARGGGQDNAQHIISTPFLVDASGRAAKVARAAGGSATGSIRQQFDGLIGLANSFSLTHPVRQFTSIEAVADGWWYAAPLGGQRLITLFMTDADLTPKAMRSADAYWDLLQQTRTIRALLPPERPATLTAPGVHPAASAYLSETTGSNWLAVGDAAYAYDPISSYGITSAIGGGFYAGNAIADHLSGRAEALPAYRHLQAQAYARYLEMQRHQYALERRWPDSAFWQRRHVAASVRAAGR